MWAAAVASVIGELEAAGDHLGDVDPRRWPEYELRRARVAYVFEDIAHLIERAGPNAEVRTEEKLSGAGGLIRGRADLIVRSDRMHVVVDYKTGHVADAAGVVNPDYVTQVQLYGYLERERSGSWPSEAYLVSFGERTECVPINPVRATAIARSALRELEEFNRRAAYGEQPARPGPTTCRYCDYAARCGPFWDACTPDWSHAIMAARGTILRVARGERPVVNINIQAEAGSIQPGPMVIRQIAVADFPQAARAHPRQVVAAVGLVTESSRHTYRLQPHGHLWIDGPVTEEVAGS